MKKAMGWAAMAAFGLGLAVSGMDAAEVAAPANTGAQSAVPVAEDPKGKAFKERVAALHEKIRLEEAARSEAKAKAMRKKLKAWRDAEKLRKNPPVVKVVVVNEPSEAEKKQAGK